METENEKEETFPLTEGSYLIQIMSRSNDFLLGSLTQASCILTLNWALNERATVLIWFEIKGSFLPTFLARFYSNTPTEAVLSALTPSILPKEKT